MTPNRLKPSPAPTLRRLAGALAIVVSFSIGNVQAADQGPRHHAEGAFDAATGTYEVVQGDDLFEIAQRFGLSITELKEGNKLASDVIDIGQKLVVAGVAEGAPAGGPQITGTLGSPSATTTISGKQLPAPEPEFGGVIPTPTMDRIANEGLRYNRVFSTALCAPTRLAAGGSGAEIDQL